MKTQVAFILFIVLGSLAGCKDKVSSGVGALDVNTFSEMINEPSEKVILDVRTPEEFYEGHIQYAKLINFHDDDFKQQVNKLDKQLPVFVYCASGVRSDKAATILKEEGFREVYVLEKGLQQWIESNHEIVK